MWSSMSSRRCLVLIEGESSTNSFFFLFFLSSLSFSILLPWLRLQRLWYPSTNAPFLFFSKTLVVAFFFCFSSFFSLSTFATDFFPSGAGRPIESEVATSTTFASPHNAITRLSQSQTNLLQLSRTKSQISAFFSSQTPTFPPPPPPDF